MLLSEVIPHVRGRASGETVEKTGVRVNKPWVLARHMHYFRRSGRRLRTTIGAPRVPFFTMMHRERTTMYVQTDTEPAGAAEANRMLHPDEARARILERVRTLPSEAVRLRNAAWRTLARDLVAGEDHPPFPAATMDGYAVIADDPSPWREIVGRQTAGHVEDIEIDLGVAAWITTGAPVPRGADAVVPIEHTELADEHVVIHQDRVAVGENIRPIGVDLAKGSVVLKAGSVIGPAEIGLLAGLGVDPVEATRRPRVSVLSTGNELVEPDEQPGPGQIRDSNRFSLVAALQEAGAEVVWAGHGPDDEVALRQALVERIAESDAVVTSGGVSMGDLDLVKPLLAELAEVHFRRVFMKPGKPFNFATSGETLIFSLPGNPVSALVGFEVFLRPALKQMLGAAEIDRPRVQVRVSHAVRPSDRIEFQRAVVRVGEDGRLVATTTGPQASSRLASLVGANALLLVPPGKQELPAGSQFDALLTGPLVSGQA
jgi:molybdenum cofactor synthesis domain-containing protein